jgi:hypothetical protein
LERKPFSLESPAAEKIIKRAYLPYWEWEEVEANMWGTVENKQDFLDRAIKFTGDAKLYGSYMLRVIEEWPNSSLHNLSNITQNRRAWVGHAACALAFQCPEDIVRYAWSFLSCQQQNEANAQADHAIAEWEKNYA